MGRGAGGPDHIAPACEDFGIAPEALESLLGSDGFDIVFACAAEDFFARSFDSEQRNVIEDYLKRRGWREGGPAKIYLRALRTSAMSLYEVVDLLPGHYLVLHDLIRGGEPVRVDERMGSETVTRWDRMALRLLSIGGTPCLAGGALPFPHETAAVLLAGIQRIAKQERAAAKRRAKRAGQPEDIPLEEVKAGILPDLAPIFTRTWLMDALGRLSQPPPRMVNFDGHDIVFTEMRYSFAPEAAAEIERRLDAAPLIERDSEGMPEWTWLQGEPWPPMAPVQGQKHAPSSDLEGEDGGWTFARIALNADSLVLTCNSRERAAAAKRKLAELLGGLIGEPLTGMQTVEQAIAENREKRGEENVPPEAVPPEIAGPLLEQFMDGHYQQCLSQPIGMLDGKTPRQAVRSKKGREQVVAWLKYLENTTARRARDEEAAAYDFTWMWEELGIADLRK